MSERVLPMFSFRSFIVSGLMFRSLIHFEFIFVYGVRKCSSFILLQVVDQTLLSKSPACVDPLFFLHGLVIFFAILYISLEVR